MFNRRRDLPEPPGALDLVMQRFTFSLLLRDQTHRKHIEYSPTQHTTTTTTKPPTCC